MNDPSLPLAHRLETSTETGLDTKPKMTRTIFSIGGTVISLLDPRNVGKRSPDSVYTSGIFIRAQHCLANLCLLD